MNGKQIFRILIDLAMTVILLLLVGYSRIGELAHEWLGISMFILFVVHHILNRKWISGLFKGKYTPFRILQTVLVFLIFCTMTGSAVSSVTLSKYIFSFIKIGGASLARTVHMLCGYWNYVLLPVHLGLHWVMMVNMVSKKLPKDKPAGKWIARVIAVLISGYGVFAMISRQIPQYLTGAIKFAFIDTSEPIIKYLIDYIAIMVLFVFIGHYLAKIFKLISKKTTK